LKEFSMTNQTEQNVPMMTGSRPINEQILTQSYVHGASPVQLIGLTVGDLFDQTAARYGDREALVSRHQHQRFTYADLQREVNRAARGPLALGLRKGERLGIWSPNRSEWVVAQFATPKIGVIMVNINPAY
jgi:fatty-acyl-CoA synthase